MTLIRPRRQARFAALVCLSILTLGFTAATVVLPPKMPVKDFSAAKAYPVDSVEAVDVVTLDMDGVKVKFRLAGANPLRHKDPGRQAARDFLNNLLRGELVYVEQQSAATEDADAPPGPPRAFLYRAPDGLLVNLELVRQGYARPDDEPFEFSEVFAYYASAARKHEKGVWGLERTPPATEKEPPPAPAEETAPPEEPQRKTENPGVVKVYVTRSGKCYHAVGCAYIAKGATELTLDEAKRRGYRPCSKCHPPQ